MLGGDSLSGTLTISTLPAVGGFALLRVADTGCGMEKELLDQIFVPFFTTRDKVRCTGLGLAVVNRIIQRAGGTISVESAPGEGCTFDIALPLVVGVETAETREMQLPLSGAGTILVVEDDQVVRRLACRALEGCGYQVIEALDSDHAIRLFENHGDEIDLLVADVVMPRKSGLQLSEIFAQSHTGLRVLYISGYDEDVALPLDLHDEPVHFLRKPFTTTSLIQKVCEVLA